MQPTKLDIFDFDGTLVMSPMPDSGRVEYEQATGEPWPFQGWWGRPESLMPPLTWRPNSDVIAAFKRSKADPNTLTVMMTGRGYDHKRYKKGKPSIVGGVLSILSDYGINLTPNVDAFFKRGAATLDWKLMMIDRFLQENPDIESVEMWEDRDPHSDAFEAHGAAIGIPIEVNRIPGNTAIRESIRMIILSEQVKRKTSAGFVVVRESDEGSFEGLGLRVYGKYDLPKGRIEKGEDPLDAALRELKEEAGITRVDMRWGDSPTVVSYANEKINQIKTSTIFLAVTDQDAVIRPNPESGIWEHHAAEWMPLDQLAEKVYPYLRDAVRWSISVIEGER